MKNAIRYDKNHVRLKTGEYVRGDKGYEFRYTVFGKEFSTYDRTLEGLREKEREIQKERQITDRDFWISI